MNWQVRKKDETKSHRTDFLLPWARSGPVTCALISDAEWCWLSPPPGGNSEYPVLAFSADEFKTAEAWRELLRLFPAHRLEVALYSAAHPDIPPEALLEALGLKTHYRSLADWKEAGHLSRAAVEFGRLYDFNVDVLRLWDRLSAEDRDGWSELFLARNFKKNLVRDIILDLYDLSAEERKRLRIDAVDFSNGWRARSDHFPSEDIRDKVRAARSPRIDQVKKEIYGLKKQLGLPAGVRLEIPSDLEAKRLEIHLEFSDVQELKEKLDQIRSPESVERIGRILEKL